MADQHPIAPGDHLSRVAAQRGFRGYPPLWDDPANRALRAKHPNPHILAAGDVVTVPALEVREVDRATEQRHRFKVTVPELVVRLALRRWDGAPMESLPAEVLVDGRARPTMVGKGTLQLPIGPNDDRITMTVDGIEVTVRIGHLQPIDTAAGVRERLNNLGYDAGDDDGLQTLQFRSAVEEFQCDRGLTVDGKVGPATRAALARAHGC